MLDYYIELPEKEDNLLILRTKYRLDNTSRSRDNLIVLKWWLVDVRAKYNSEKRIENILSMIISEFHSRTLIYDIR